MILSIEGLSFSYVESLDFAITDLSIDVRANQYVNFAKQY
jgi:hypothetical protein